MGGLKIRRHGELMREVRALRERCGFREELRFNCVTRAKLPFYNEVIGLLAGADMTFHACVVDREVYDPFKRDAAPSWRQHADVVARLLAGCIVKREFVTAIIDMVSTPPDVAYEDRLRQRVNRRIGNGTLVTATMHDSRCDDGLQLVDLMVGAVALDRRRLVGQNRVQNSHKSQLAARIASLFNVSSLEDTQTPRLNIRTLGEPSTARSGVVQMRRAAGHDAEFQG